MAAASVGIPSFGTLIKKETASGTYTQIIEVVDFDGPNMTRGSIEMTHMLSQSFTREFIGGLRDMGEMTVNFHFVPTDATHQLIYEDMALGYAPIATNVDSWVINFPDAAGTTWGPLSGFVTAFKVSGGAVDQPLMGSFTVKFDGKTSTTLP